MEENFGVDGTRQLPSDHSLSEFAGPRELCRKRGKDFVRAPYEGLSECLK